MKVLIAGATGALGVPLVRALIGGGHDVIGITRTPGKSSLLTRLGAQPIVADAMAREGLLRAVNGRQADAVVHVLTALPKGGPMRHRDMYQTDALRDVGTRHLLAAAREVGARKIVVESMHVGYGFGNWGDSVLTEEQPFAPPGRSQELERHLAGFRSMEHQIFEATRAGWIEGLSLRYGAFYGPDSTAPLIKLLRRRSLPLPGGGRTFMSWIYIEDAAAAMVAALERGRAGQAYNIVDDEPVRWHPGTLVHSALGAAASRSLCRDLSRRDLAARLQRQGQGRTGVGAECADLSRRSPKDRPSVRSCQKLTGAVRARRYRAPHARAGASAGVPLIGIVSSI
jgi:nucleoside-diphosphate-sugar epimerase